MTAPAAMPSEEDVARVRELLRGIPTGIQTADQLLDEAARIFAPILVEKEREIERLRAATTSAEERLGDMIDASKEEWSKHGANEMALGQWKARAAEAENGRDEWRRLFCDERRSQAALEARALAAEAVLAELRKQMLADEGQSRDAQ